MSLTGLLRKVGYFAMGVVCLSVVAIVFAWRTPSSMPRDEVEHIAEGQQETPEPNETPANPEEKPPLPRKRQTARGPVPAAIELPDTDPFLDLPAETTVAKTAPTSSAAAQRSQTERKTLPTTFDPRETSWEDPFVASYWEGTGWSFSPEGMTSKEKPATATFRRSYRRLMLEARVQPLQAPVAPLQLRLLAPATGATVVIALHAEELVVTGNGRAPGRVQERATLSPALAPGKSALLRIGATGNRLMFHWNNQVVLTCDQPAAQSGRDLMLEWSSAGTSYRISYLRLEGE